MSGLLTIFEFVLMAIGAVTVIAIIAGKIKGWK